MKKKVRFIGKAILLLGILGLTRLTLCFGESNIRLKYGEQKNIFGGCLLDCVGNENACITIDGCNGQSKENCSKYEYRIGTGKTSYSCSGEYVINCTLPPESYKECYKAAKCMWYDWREECDKMIVWDRQVYAYTNCLSVPVP